jgi:hypothetical protein
MSERDDETEERCPYSEAELEDMMREEKAGMMDIEAWEVYVEAERRGFDPNVAVQNHYVGERQEWET